MKILIASDLHGSAYYTERLLAAFAREGAERLLLLGDLLYHGPRNDLPRGYAPKEVIAMLSPLKDQILAVRGNCDAEVDQMVLPFPIMADYEVLPIGDRSLLLTHGHVFGEDNPPPHAEGDIVLGGHTHVPRAAEHDGYTFLNPGSVSIPKEGSAHGYLLFEEGVFFFKTLDGACYQKYEIAK